jgi:transposase
MPEEVEKIRAENAQLRQQLAEKDKKITSLEKEIEKLKGQFTKDIKEIKKAVRTPDWIREERVRRQRDAMQKRKEEQERQGVSRKNPDHVDEIKDAKLPCCPDCGGKLSKPVETRERFIEDIQPVRTKITKHRIPRKYCKKCKKIVEPKITEAFPNFRFGLFLCLYIVALKIGLSMPVRRIKEILRLTYQLRISSSEIQNIIDRVAEEFGPEYERMAKELKKMKSIYADETSWYINGKLVWLWIFINKEIAFYHIQNSRGRKVPAKILRGFTGALISDFYGAYSQGKISQKCLVHLLRDIFNWKTLKYFNDSELKSFALGLKKIILEAIRTEEKSKDKRAYFEKKLMRLLAKDCKSGEVKRMRRRLEKHFDSIFTFLEYDVEFSNNRAERGLRPCVVARKISYGSRSKTGALHYATLKSIVETCNLKEQNFMDYAKEHIVERITSES